MSPFSPIRVAISLFLLSTPFAFGAVSADRIAQVMASEMGGSPDLYRDYAGSLAVTLNVLPAEALSRVLEDPALEQVEGGRGQADRPETPANPGDPVLEGEHRALVAAFDAAFQERNRRFRQMQDAQEDYRRDQRQNQFHLDAGRDVAFEATTRGTRLAFERALARSQQAREQFEQAEAELSAWEAAHPEF